MDDVTGIGLQRHRLARRGFMMTSVMTGFSLATTTVEAQAIHTDTKGLVAGAAQIPVSDGHLPGYAARPDGAGPFPTILVIEEVFGVNAYLQDVCRRFAKLGYLAVAPEIYARIADLSKITNDDEIGRVIAQSRDSQIMSDLDATAAWATQHHGDPARLGVAGFCRGGRDVWLYAAHNPHLKAAVSWYGVLDGKTSAIQPQTALDVADKILCPLLGLYGSEDVFNPVPMIHQAEAKAKAAGKTVEIVIYPDTPHGFHADYRPSYREAAAKDSWRRALAWFKRYDVA
ncbi:MAG TPA: dienelactone hydrolase family protein [Acetobacteraceae bacterium]